MQRRHLMLNSSTAIVTPAILMLSCSVLAQPAYPDKPIRMIIPFPPGGTTDTMGRLFADQIGRELNQIIVVENRDGAGGSIGSAAVGDALADGYTLGIATASTHGINPAAYPKLAFDTGKDFTPVSSLASVPNTMAINPKVTAKTMAEFIQSEKSEPGKLTYAPAVADKLTAAAEKVETYPQVREKLHTPGATTGHDTSQESAAQIFAEIAKNKRIAKEANIRLGSIG